MDYALHMFKEEEEMLVKTAVFQRQIIIFSLKNEFLTLANREIDYIQLVSF